MRFKSTNGRGLQRELEEAALWGYPGASGLYALAGEADLRNEIYAPEAGFTEIAASFMSALFPECIDPRMAQRLAERAFGLVPTTDEAASGIVLVDLAGGPSASSADYEAAFLAGILAERRAAAGRRVLVAVARGSEAAALAEASAGIPGLDLVLLGGGEPFRGVKSARLRREGGHVSLVSVRGGAGAAQALVREISGRSLDGVALIPAGPANPARLAARTILQIASFIQCRSGLAGDVLCALPSADGFALAAGLYAWDFGLPMTGYVLPLGAGSLAADDEGSELVEAFDRERPGLLRSIVVYESADEYAKAADELSRASGPELDTRSLRSLAAALALSGRLKGHGRIMVPRLAHPWWDGPGLDASAARNTAPASLSGSLLDARADAEIGGAYSELEGLLSAILGG
jgi:threonine synthase